MLLLRRQAVVGVRGLKIRHSRTWTRRHGLLDLAPHASWGPNVGCMSCRNRLRYTSLFPHCGEWMSTRQSGMEKKGRQRVQEPVGSWTPGDVRKGADVGDDKSTTLIAQRQASD